jgi:hypothetical protein
MFTMNFHELTNNRQRFCVYCLFIVLFDVFFSPSFYALSLRAFAFDFDFDFAFTFALALLSFA